ncbi:MAG: hypothetical protein SNG27_09295 [Rikenellaceae bacterium]
MEKETPPTSAITIILTAIVIIIFVAFVIWFITLSAGESLFIMLIIAAVFVV